MESTKKHHKADRLVQASKQYLLTFTWVTRMLLKTCKNTQGSISAPRPVEMWSCVWIMCRIWTEKGEKKIKEFCLPPNIKVKDGPQVISCKEEKQQEYTWQLKAVCRGVKYCWIPRWRFHSWHQALKMQDLRDRCQI